MVFLLACLYTSTWCQRQVAWNLIVMSFSKSETKYKQTAKLRIKPQSDMLRQNATRTKPSAKTMHGHPGAATKSHGSGRKPPGGPEGRPVRLVFYQVGQQLLNGQTFTSTSSKHQGWWKSLTGSFLPWR